MPANAVPKGKEKQWSQAKEAAASEGHGKDYPYIMGIFERILAHVGGGKMPKTNPHEPKMQQLMHAAQEHAEHKKMGKMDLEDNLDEESEVKFKLPKMSKKKA